MASALFRFGVWHKRRDIFPLAPAAFRQIRIKEPEHMRALDRANAFLLLQIGNALAKLFHLRPVHFRAEMVFGVVTVVKEKPVIDFSVTAYAPGNRFVRIRTVMPIVTVQITEAVTEIPERQKK